MQILRVELTSTLRVELTSTLRVELKSTCGVEHTINFLFIQGINKHTQWNLLITDKMAVMYK